MGHFQVQSEVGPTYSKLSSKVICPWGGAALSRELGTFEFFGDSCLVLVRLGRGGLV